MESEFKYLAQKSTSILSAKPVESKLHPYTHIFRDKNVIAISSPASHKPDFKAKTTL
jgi:hypothetical protein